MKAKWLSLVLTLAFLLTVMAPISDAAPKTGGGKPGKPQTTVNPASAKNAYQLSPKKDNRTDALTTRQQDLKKKAIDAKLNGKANGKTKEVARGQFVELEREGEDAIWTVLGEFSDLKHNSIAEPDRSVNNNLIWTPDFSRDYFMDLLFSQGTSANSMRQYYLEQSSNRYTINGDVTDWVSVPGVAKSYDDDLESSQGGNAVWYFIKDSINQWYEEQLAAGKTKEQINTYLKEFDVWDRYDYDSDGDFDEPDGYIDHMQFVHAGEGNEAGGGILGDSAIWSHSWYAFSGLAGEAGPDFNKLGGLQIGNSDIWVGKYTIQPENGGVGVFTHEFAHDLGIPDLYDTNGGTNSTGFWTLMSSGSWLSDGKTDIGSKPGHLGVWEKFQLGWLNYQVASAGTAAEFKVGPAETNTKQAQGLFVILPKKTVVSEIGSPYAGTYYYYSGTGDEVDNFMYKSVNLPVNSSLSAMVRFDIELDWDYAYVVVSEDDGINWAPVPTNLSTALDPNGQNKGHGITGTKANWVNLTANLSAYSGDVLVGFRYWTDVAVSGLGFMADNIQINGEAFGDAETDEGWQYKPDTGFHTTTGIESKRFSHYYIAEFRQYRGYDASLKTAYNFGFLDDPIKQETVEWYPYQDGLLISYWDTAQNDNNVSDHPGSGLVLPIDSHPTVMMNADGKALSNRIQTFDSTFSLEQTDPIALHFNSVPVSFPSQKAVPVFNDRKSWFNPDHPTMSVDTPNTGTIIEIRSYSALDNFMQVQVRPAK